MHTNLEIEYKTMITREQFEGLIQSYPNAKIIRQTNTYFKSATSDQKKSIRIREIDGKFIFTCKIPTTKGIIEKEMAVKGNQTKDLNEPEILQFLASVNLMKPYTKEGELHTERHLIIDPYGELCLDKNYYNNQIDYEIEYEIKGNPEKGFNHFLSILKEHQIQYTPSPLSKYARCIKQK